MNDDGSIAGFIVRTRTLGEADVIVTLFVEGLGKVDALARGARKSRRRFSGGLTVGLRGRAWISPGRGGLAEFRGFNADPRHLCLGQDLEVFAYAHYICELCDELTPLGEGNNDVYALGDEALLELYVHGAHPSVLRRFEWGMLNALGIAWPLETCAQCGQAAVERDGCVAFRQAGGGSLCLAHLPANPEAILWLPQALVDLLLASADGSPIPRAEFEAISAPARRELRHALFSSLSSQLRAPLRSLAILGQFAALNRTSKP
jgi:DNA repair protein RecO (recombination protein O)